MGVVWSELGQVMRWSECKTNALNRFPVPKNMDLEYPHTHVMIIDIRKFWIFRKKFQRYGMGVVRNGSGDGLSVKLIV